MAEEAAGSVWSAARDSLEYIREYMEESRTTGPAEAGWTESGSLSAAVQAELERREAERAGRSQRWRGGLGRPVLASQLEPCGAWACPLEAALGPASSESPPAHCAICESEVRARGMLSCQQCEGTACALCWLRIVSAAGGGEGRWPSCPFCRVPVPQIRVLQLSLIHAGHSSDLPFPNHADRLLQLGGPHQQDGLSGRHLQGWAMTGQRQLPSDPPTVYESSLSSSVFAASQSSSSSRAEADLPGAAASDWLLSTAERRRSARPQTSSWLLAPSERSPPL